MKRADAARVGGRHGRAGAADRGVLPRGQGRPHRPLFAHMDPGHPNMWRCGCGGVRRPRALHRRAWRIRGTCRRTTLAQASPSRSAGGGWPAHDAADEVGSPDDPSSAPPSSATSMGTRPRRQNSQPGAEPPPQAPVPHWGWGVAPPYSGTRLVRLTRLRPCRSSRRLPAAHPSRNSAKRLGDTHRRAGDVRVGHDTSHIRPHSDQRDGRPIHTPMPHMRSLPVASSMTGM